jgi:hypothetical protein
MPSPTPSPSRAPLLSVLTDLRDLFVSLKLTIVLLGFSLVLVFAGTLDQVNLGIWAVQERYFRSFIVYTQVGGLALPVFPGGYTIGGLLLLNLVAAHVFRFGFAWRKTGIVLTHLGLIVLLVGELLTGLWQEDFALRLTEGETKNYAESFRQHELVFIDVSDPAFDRVVAIPEALLARKAPLQHPALPFRATPRTYFANSTLQMRDAAAAGAAPDLASHITAAPLPLTHRPDERNVPSAILELATPDGPAGTYLVSGHLGTPQVFTAGGRTWQIALRLRRTYQPFSLTLLKFSHDRYAGTEIPKNFSSQLRLTTPDGRDDREVLIYMNNPLRHGGLTFYQAGFENDDRTTILQVVRNPSWLVPYIACTLMTLGLTVQFTIHLFGFVRRRSVRTAPVPAPLPSATPEKRPAPRTPAAPLAAFPNRATASRAHP